jgi:hypothetical protein
MDEAGFDLQLLEFAVGSSKKVKGDAVELATALPVQTSAAGITEIYLKLRKWVQKE